MIEILLLVAASGARAVRCRPRGLRVVPYVVVATIGWLALHFAGGAISSSLGQPGIRFMGIAAGWLWIGAVYFQAIRFTRGGAKVEDGWQCPDCRMFNDAVTLRCLCGYVHPAASRRLPSDRQAG